MVRTCGEKDRGRYSNEGMAVSGYQKIEEQNLFYKKRHEGERSTERRSTRLENVEIENLILQPQNEEKAQEEGKVTLLSCVNCTKAAGGCISKTETFEYYTLNETILCIRRKIKLIVLYCSF